MGRVLVACEYSGRVRKAFAAQGHDASPVPRPPKQRVKRLRADAKAQHRVKPARPLKHPPSLAR